jgi:hypothetical protein
LSVEAIDKNIVCFWPEGDNDPMILEYQPQKVKGGKMKEGLHRVVLPVSDPGGISSADPHTPARALPKAALSCGALVTLFGFFSNRVYVDLMALFRLKGLINRK